jgi:glucosamine-6-phosphate deaminase
MAVVEPRALYTWCKIPYQELEGHPDLKIPFRLCQSSEEMGRIMARELVDEIKARNQHGEELRAIIPCGPSCWYAPFTQIVNSEGVNLSNLIVFHMDECLDWQARLLPLDHPLSFQGYMLKHFYEPVREDLAVPEKHRIWLTPSNMNEVEMKIQSAPVDLAYGGIGQDGHIAYNQARRHPYSRVSIDELRDSGIRIQENNMDTILALAHRNFGCAYQFVPPMSVTLGVKEILSAKKIRIFTDTGAWKQTALRAALFGPITEEYPMTLLQEHPDALITATVDTARHPFSEHPDWNLVLKSDDWDATKPREGTRQ